MIIFSNDNVRNSPTQGTIYGAIASVVLLGWFMMTAQVYNVEHNTTSKPLPSSIDGCEDFNVTLSFNRYTIRLQT